MTEFFRLRRGALSAEGRFIPMILLILSNFLFKVSYPIGLADFQAAVELKLEPKCQCLY